MVSSFIIDNFNGDPDRTSGSSVTDNTIGDGGVSAPSPIDDLDSIVMNSVGGGDWSRQLFAELLGPDPLSGGEEVSTIVCYGCEEGHAFSSVPEADGDFEWRYTGGTFDASEFEDFMIDYLDATEPGGVVELYLDGELAAQSDPLPEGNTSVTLPLLISDDIVSNVTIRVDGVEGLYASIDNAKLVADFEPDFGTTEADTIEVEGSNRLIFAGDSNDLIDASTGEGNNRLYAGSGDDTLILGSGDRVFGNDGDDRFFVLSGGENTITGGADADQFWIANAEIPDEINTITDFTSGEDVIGIAGFGIEFEDITLTQQGSDALVGINDIDLALLEDFDIADLSEDDFAFG